MFKIPPLVTALGFYLLLYTEGCGRTPAKPAPPPTTTPSYVNSTVPENHRLACTENETQQKACLHGGTCLASVLDNYRTISCQCPDKYVGDRCQMIDPTIIFGREEKEKVTRAGLAAGITALILFLTVLIFILIWHRRYKRKKEREKEEKQKQQEESLLKNGDLNNGNYKPALNLSRNRDSYSERIPLTELPLNQTDEIKKEEERPLQENFTFSDSDIKRLSILSYIRFVDDDDDVGAVATNV